MITELYDIIIFKSENFIFGKISSICLVRFSYVDNWLGLFFSKLLIK